MSSIKTINWACSVKLIMFMLTGRKVIRYYDDQERKAHTDYVDIKQNGQATFSMPPNGRLVLQYGND